MTAILKKIKPVLFLGIVGLLFSAMGRADDSRLLELRKDVFRSIAQIHQLSLTRHEVLREATERLAESPFVCQGRLTLSSGTPIPTTDLSNQSTVYFTPYLGSRVALYTGTVWVIHAFTERSLALSGLSASTNYDVFLYNNSGTLTLELTAWSSATARATALTTVNGVYVRSGATTRRYLGTIRATSATQTQDTAQQRFVWNYYNRVKRVFAYSETADSWAYVTAAFRNVNNTATTDFEMVVGLQETPVFVRGMLLAVATATLRDNISTSFGLDGTTSITSMSRGASARNTLRVQMWCETLQPTVGLGYHSLEWLEYGAANVTFYGDDGGDARLQSGTAGWIYG